MPKDDKQSYVALQRHLDSQAIGFPATKSGVELKILAHIFTPREAQIATSLSFRFETLEAVFAKARQWVDSPEALARVLDDLQIKGGIETKVENGVRRYCNAPLVVGMYELQLDRLTPAFLTDFHKYVSSPQFGLAFLSTAQPQMRTIPVAKSITPSHNVSTYDQVKILLDEAEPPFVIIECICRKSKTLRGKSCQVTEHQETCLAIGHMAQTLLDNGTGRQISLEETLSIIERNQKDGLVLQPSNTEKAEFICSCCGCCCGMLSMHKSLPVPVDFWASNFQARVDTELCDGCGICVRRCQVNAAVVAVKKEPARIDLKRCIGCGLCVAQCPRTAIDLIEKKERVKPPRTREDLQELIMANKKGRWGKVKLSAKLVIDTLRSGQRPGVNSPEKPKPERQPNASH